MGCGQLINQLNELHHTVPYSYDRNNCIIASWNDVKTHYIHAEPEITFK